MSELNFLICSYVKRRCKAKNKIPKEKKLFKPHSKKLRRHPKDQNDEATSSTLQYNTNEDEGPRRQQTIKFCQKNSVSNKTEIFLARNTVQQEFYLQSINLLHLI